MKDRLYLLKPHFEDAKQGAGHFFCAQCAVVEGMLSFYPHLRQAIDVHYVAYKRPRPQIVAELGEAHQSSPVLVLADASPIPQGVDVQTSQGKRFIDHELMICNYLAARYKADAPHP
jgi:hypothetical protein